MKTIYLLLVLLATLAEGATFAQTIRRVNNNPGITGLNVYTTLQAAHDAAVSGDVIYVEPSGTSYGSLTCSKRLTIIGNGYLLDQNANTSVNKTASYINSATFNVGSAQSIITGLVFGGPGSALATGTANFFDANITITRCYLVSVGLLHSGTVTSPTNCTISKCLIAGSINYAYGLTSGYPVATGTMISNNIFAGNGGAAINGLFNATIINNTIYTTLGASGNPVAAIQNIGNTAVTNNIIDYRAAPSGTQVVGVSPGTTEYINNTISNNICLGQNGLPATNGNVNGATATSNFQVANPWLTDSFNRNYFEQDATFQLAAASPAKGIGTSGTDAGAFGGPSPYVLSGLPAYPVITAFTTSGAGNTTTPLNVTISVRSNN